MKKDISSNELLLSDTLVPDIFINQYIQDLSSDAVKLYLWILMNYKYDEFEQKQLASYTFISANGLNEAIAELISNDLLTKKNDKILVLSDLKMREVLEFAKNYSAKSNNLDGTELLAEEQARNVLAKSVSNTFYLGKMANWAYRLVDKCLYQYNMHSSVVYKLFEEGKDKSIHVVPAKMQKMAEDWYNHGYVDIDKLEAYFEKKARTNSVIDVMGRLARRRLNGVDIERINNWVDIWDVSPDLCEYAFRQNEYRGSVTLKHVEDLLSKWSEAGITTIDKAMVYQNERHQENKTKSSRKRGSDNVWKTGAEAGITRDDKGNDSVAANNDVVSGIDDILDMFGASNEDD